MLERLLRPQPVVHLAHALAILLKPEGDVVVYLTDKFPKDATDLEWMDALGKEGDWVVISGDISIHKNKAKREAWRRAGLLAFFLGAQWEARKHVEKAAVLLRWWPLIENQARLVKPPAAFEIPFRFGNGQFRQLKG